MPIACLRDICEYVRDHGIPLDEEYDTYVVTDMVTAPDDARLGDTLRVRRPAVFNTNSFSWIDKLI